jgi:hypothetical protein
MNAIETVHPDFNLATQPDLIFLHPLLIRPVVTFMRDNIDVLEIALSTDTPRDIGLRLADDLDRQYDRYSKASLKIHDFAYDSQNPKYDSAPTLGMQRLLMGVRKTTIGTTNMSAAVDSFNRYFAGSFVPLGVDNKIALNVKAMVQDELINVIAAPSFIEKVKDAADNNELDPEYAWLKSAQVCTTLLLEEYRRYSLAQAGNIAIPTNEEPILP